MIGREYREYLLYYEVFTRVPQIAMHAPATRATHPHPNQQKRGTGDRGQMTSGTSHNPRTLITATNCKKAESTDSFPLVTLAKEKSGTRIWTTTPQITLLSTTSTTLSTHQILQSQAVPYPFVRLELCSIFIHSLSVPYSSARMSPPQRSMVNTCPILTGRIRGSGTLLLRRQKYRLQCWTNCRSLHSQAQGNFA